jgi:hypothetical protein
MRCDQRGDTPISHAWAQNRKTSIVTLADDERSDSRRHRRSSRSRRILGEARELAPRFEACGQLFAMEARAQQMALECEVLVDRTEAREKALRAFAVSKPSHAPLALPCGLVAVLGAIVNPSTGLHEHVLHVRKLRDSTARHSQ